MVTLKRDLAGETPKAVSAARLLTLAGNPNWQIAQCALTALLDATALPPPLVWNAAILASELSLNHRGSDEHGMPDQSLQKAHRAEATNRALTRLKGEGETLAPLTPPPAAWIRQVSRVNRRHAEADWTRPDPDFEPYYAKDLIGHFPIQTWATSAEHSAALLRYADELVRWTADRLFPSWENRRDRERHAANLYEWLSALAPFVARVAILVPDGYVRFIEPIAKHEDQVVLTFLSDVIRAITTRYVYDAPLVSEEALSLLTACMDRMLAEHTFDPDSYRAGEIDTRDLYPMVTSFLLVSAKDAPGAARFANGEWTDLPRLMPLIERLMMAAGWSAGVMRTSIWFFVKGPGLNSRSRRSRDMSRPAWMARASGTKAGTARELRPGSPMRSNG